MHVRSPTVREGNKNYSRVGSRQDTVSDYGVALPNGRASDTLVRKGHASYK